MAGHINDAYGDFGVHSDRVSEVCRDNRARPRVRAGRRRGDGSGVALATTRSSPLARAVRIVRRIIVTTLNPADRLR